MTTPIDEQYLSAIRLHQNGKFDAAARLYNAILAAVPDHAGALHLKGVLALQAGGYRTATELIERSLAIMPDNGLALSNLSVALRSQGRILESIAALEKSVALDASSANAWANLAQTQMEAGLTREGVASARRALALAPDRLVARQSMMFGMNYLAELDPLALIADARIFGELAEQQTPPRTRHDNDPDPDRPLRVGLVSADLRKHPVGRFLAAMLDEIDPARLVLHAYSDTPQTDEITVALKASVPHWHETGRLSHAALGEQIVADKIDVLVDLVGHTSQRMAVFAGKPAPVSFTWLGYFATTGLTAIDYVLANRWVVPPAEENQWVEKIWRMPASYLCFTVPTDAPPPSPLPALETGRVTFGCFNNFGKLSDPTLSTWARLLEAVPNSHLIVRSSGNSEAGVVANLRQQMTAAGLDLARVRIDPRISGYAAHLASYAEIDIALDPFPYNGGTTTVEALYMGVPVLVKAGDRYVAHMGESILHNTGLADWIAPDEAGYIALGTAKAADLDALASLRSNLRTRMLASPLFDAPRFARDFEDAVRGMWRVWCAAQGRG